MRRLKQVVFTTLVVALISGCSWSSIKHGAFEALKSFDRSYNASPNYDSYRVDISYYEYESMRQEVLRDQ